MPYARGRFGVAKAAASNAGDPLYGLDWSAWSSGGIKQFFEKKNISGIVRYQGSPVADALVFVLDQELNTLLKLCNTDQNGNFSTQVFAGRKYIVMAFKESITDSNADVAARIDVPTS